jgi:branched-chain amino acid aminotransferase
MKLWYNGELTTEGKARVSLLTHALHYGSSVFEGIRFYETEHGRAVFRLDDHLKRLRYSAQQLGMRMPYTQKQLKQAVLDTVRANKAASGYIRPLLFYGTGSLGLSPTQLPVNAAVIVLPWGKYIEREAVEVMTATTERVSSASANTAAKIGGVYVNSILANNEAKQAGYDEALLLDRDGFVAEGAAENCFIAVNGTLKTPTAEHILPGITRATVMQLAHEHAIPTEETHLTIGDIYHADEFFFTGTAAEVTPVTAVDGTTIGDGLPGPITTQLLEQYQRVVTGAARGYKRWLTYVDQ